MLSVLHRSLTCKRAAAVQRRRGFSNGAAASYPAPLQHPAFADLMFRPAPRLAYVEPQDLADMLKSEERSRIAVIDVRDSVSGPLVPCSALPGLPDAYPAPCIVMRGRDGAGTASCTCISPRRRRCL